MNSRRTARVASVVREVVSNAVLFELRDPRIRNVTVTRVEVSGDLQNAKIYVSVMADEKATSLCMHGLDSARGYIQSKLADRIKTRYTPALRFILDEGVKKSFEVTRILQEVLPAEASAAEANADPDAGDPGTAGQENTEDTGDEFDES